MNSNITINTPKDVQTQENTPIVDLDEQNLNRIIHSEYETASEFEPDFHSDVEPPSDKVYEARMVIKEKNLRIYKKIIKLGRKINMPSKYDRVRFKYTKCEKENLEENVLESEPWFEKQMGIDSDLSDIQIQCLQFMKKGEISSFRIEYITYNQDKHLRYLDREEYAMYELSEWETIIDVFGDFQVMKHLEVRGVKQARLSPYNEALLSLKLIRKQKNGENLEIFKFTNLNLGPQVIDDLIPLSLLELLQTMKEEEKCKFKISREYFEEFKNEEIYSSINENTDQMIEGEAYPFEMVAEVRLFLIIEDLFNNGSVLKKSLKNSYSTSCPDIHSRIYFDYSISDKDGNVLVDGFKNRLKANRMNELNFEFYEESTCSKSFLDNYSLSKALRTAIRAAKKLEEFELVVKDSEKVKDGKDVSQVLKKSGADNIESLLPLKYDVIVYTFSMGDSAYSMGVAEKLRFYNDRRQVVVRLLKSKSYKRALKVLTYLKEVIENVSSSHY